MDPSWKVYVSGHRGMVGSAVVRKLEALGYEEIETSNREELDLTDQTAVRRFFELEKPDAVVIGAAKVGGIGANNTYPAEFIYENLMITANQVHAAYEFGVKRLLFLGSSCIYPKHAPQPMPEDCLLTSKLEPTNEAYAVAKIAGLKLCQYYRKQYGVMFHSLMPTNLYGPGDNYHLENSHVLPALIRKLHEAKERKDPQVVMWGTGTPMREFLHVDDLADASLFLMNLDNPPDWVNVGSGDEVTIRNLAEIVKEAVGYEGSIVQDVTKPDGTPRKLLDISKLTELNWKRKIDLQTGIKQTYASFLEEQANGTLRG
jgi:GDP-L-fucose synthase